MDPRENFGSGVSWESTYGYSRAVRVGRHVWIAGTTAVDEAGSVVSPGDAYAQTVVVLNKIRTALERAGGGLEHVVRTRMFATHAGDHEAIGRAHGEFFAGIRPASTLVQVAGLIDPAMRIEIEADAVLEGD